VRDRLGEEIERLRRAGPDVTWVAAENLHVTLRFLGRIEESQVGPLAAAVAVAVSPLAPFEATVGGLGAFPTRGRARVIWAGVAEGAPAMVRAAAAVEAALVPFGFQPESRPFAPHVTLGRRREPRPDRRLAAALEAGAARPFGQTRIDHVSLMRSDLSPRGARYTELAACRLG
jgi:2'-5' RNA ligase